MLSAAGGGTFESPSEVVPSQPHIVLVNTIRDAFSTAGTDGLATTLRMVPPELQVHVRDLSAADWVAAAQAASDDVAPPAAGGG